jgi:hypothetical protein
LTEHLKGVSSSGGRVRCRMRAPFWGKVVVIGRSSGPPGRRSLTTVSAKAGAEVSARVAAPALPRNCRRHESECEQNAFPVTMATSPAEFRLVSECSRHLVSECSRHQELTLSGFDPWCYNSPGERRHYVVRLRPEAVQRTAAPSASSALGQIAKNSN